MFFVLDFTPRFFSFRVLPRTLDLVGITPEQGMSKDLRETREKDKREIMRDSIFTATASLSQQSEPTERQGNLRPSFISVSRNCADLRDEITNNDSHLEFSRQIIWNYLYCSYLNLHTSLPW